MKKIFFTLMILAATLAASAKDGVGKYVGGDISNLPLYEEHNSGYLDASGTKIDDLIVWLNEKCGWNTFRVRIFVNPSKKDHSGNTDNAVAQDLEYVKALGARIKAQGCKFMLDFHYSDTWADAGVHSKPSAWADATTDDALATKVSEYTTSVLQALKAADATPDFVQVGNEIMYGMAGINVAPYDQSSSNWDGFIKIVKAGCEAVRTECPNAEIILHTDRPGNAEYIKYWYGKMDAASVPYDVIGLSYYPFWHGWLTDLANGLDECKTDFASKKVQIVETGYYFQNWPSSGINYNTSSTWAASTAGQYGFICDLIDKLADYPQVEGLSYWNPEDAGNGDDTDWSKATTGTVEGSWSNRGLWWPSTSSTGHWPVTSSGNFIATKMKDFLAPETAVETVKGQQTVEIASAPKAVMTKNGIVIKKGDKKYNVAGAIIE